jgi:hypothetical protein
MATRSSRFSRNAAGRLSALVALGSSVLLIAACTTGSNEESGKPEFEQPPQLSTKSTDGSSAAPLMHLAAQVAFARRDFARQHDASPDAVSILNARPVQWRSGALGCPEQGMSYTQALVPGVQILLKYEDEIAAYHAAVGAEPFRCPLSRVETPVYDQDSDQL